MSNEPKKTPASPSPGDDRKVTVFITPLHHAVMDPPLEIVKAKLYYSVTNFRPGGPTGVQKVVEELQCCGLDRNGRLAFPAGLWPHILEILNEHEYQVTTVDQREDGPRLSINPE